MVAKLNYLKENEKILVTCQVISLIKIQIPNPQHQQRIKIEDGGHSTGPNRSNRSGKSGLNPGSKDEKFVSQGVGKNGKNIEDSNQNTDVEGSIRDGQVVFNHSGNGGFKDFAVMNPLYQNEGENSNNNGGVVDGLISDDGEVV
ncbi:hypothetical protein AgCh_009405 [Apium graveolens]